MDSRPQSPLSAAMQRKRMSERADSAPPARRVRQISRPDLIFDQLGDKAARTAAAFADLAEAISVDLWPKQVAIAEAVCHEMLAIRDESWRTGVEHGKWLAAKKIEESRKDLDHLEKLQSSLYSLQLRFTILQGQYDQAKQMIASSSDSSLE